MRHAKNQALHALDEGVGAVDFILPIAVGQRNVALEIKMKARD